MTRASWIASISPSPAAPLCSAVFSCAVSHVDGGCCGYDIASHTCLPALSIPAQAISTSRPFACFPLQKRLPQRHRSSHRHLKLHPAQLLGPFRNSVGPATASKSFAIAFQLALSSASACTHQQAARTCENQSDCFRRSSGQVQLGARFVLARLASPRDCQLGPSRPSL